MRPPVNARLIALSVLGFGSLAFLVWQREALLQAPDASGQHAAEARASSTASEQTKAEENKLILGGVAAVPFEEVYGVLSRRSSEEIAELARQLQNLPKGPATEIRIVAFFKAWAALDSSAAFASAGMLRRDLKSAALKAVLEGADASGAGLLIPAIADLPKESLRSSEKAQLLARAIGKWSQVDPVAAAKFLASSGERGMNFSMAYNSVASNWAARDPAAALAWARQAATKGERFAISGAITGWWKNDPTAAEAYVASHLATREDWQLASTLASNIFSEDPERAKEWVSGLPNEEARKQATAGLTIQWGFSDPAAATEWASTLPAGERDQSLAETIGLWTAEDPAAAAQWLGSYDGPGRDQAINNFSLNVAFKDPAAALTWAATISDPKMRASAERSLAGAWLKRDPQAARSWIENSSLSVEEKSQLLVSSTGP
jgi:hypothetical protein